MPLEVSLQRSAGFLQALPPQYDYLVLCGTRKNKRGGKTKDQAAAVPNKTGGPYWTMVCRRLDEVGQMDGRKFLLILKELEFRYNHRDGDIFDLTAEYLCRFEKPKARPLH